MLLSMNNFFYKKCFIRVILLQFFSLLLNIAQLTFTYSMSTIETLKKGGTYVKVNIKMMSFWC